MVPHLLVIVLFTLTGYGNAQYQYILDTPGCKIPDAFNMTFKDGFQKISCGVRHIYVSKISDRVIQFKMKKPFEACCYRYVLRSNVQILEDKSVSFSPCMPFRNNTKVTLANDFLKVKCTKKDHVVYEDAYAFVRKIDRKKAGNHKGSASHNVIIIAIESMSRARAYNSLPATVNYLNKNNWLDYRGYHKVVDQTLPNLAAILTGRNGFLSGKKLCSPDMSACNDLFIWTKFRDDGYVTAFGEDGIGNKGMFQRRHGFRIPPTHHYMTPQFIANEKLTGHTYCTKKVPSGIQMLDYIYDFAKTYQKKKAFGVFWIRSFSSDKNQSPKSLDKPLADLFANLRKYGFLKNTFLILLGDQGTRYGPLRAPIDAYYDERLPMLFISPPESFKKSYRYPNMVANQHRVISPYDLYLTLWDILKLSSGEVAIPKAKGCLRCMSLFLHMTDHRTCTDAGIHEEWCTCHLMHLTCTDDYGAMYSVIKITEHMQTTSLAIPTKSCTSCIVWSFHKVTRLHSFSYVKGVVYYVVAFIVNPNGLMFEAIVKKAVDHQNRYIYDIASVKLISEYRGYGYCVKAPKDEQFCMCKKSSQCV